MLFQWNEIRRKLMDKRERLGIPKYTLGEELVNSISHGLGAVFGIVALVLCVVFSVRQGDAWKIVSSAIYGASMIVLYSISTIYHALGINLAKLESRPIPERDFEFMFYFDFDGDILDDSVRSFIAELDNGSQNFKLLGAYKESL